MTVHLARVRRRRIGWLIPLLLISAAVIAILVMQVRPASVSLNAPVLPPPTPTPSITPRPTATQLPTATPHPVKVKAERAPTVTTPVPTPTPTIIVPPAPLLPPVSDGVKRTANVPILMYHYISVPPSSSDRLRVGLSVAPDMFEAQMKLLIDKGFHTISLFDLYEHLAVGKPLPDKPIILTFDDGYADNYYSAFPILKKYGMTATFFVLTGRPDEGDPVYMTWDMIKEMSAVGMDIQLHAKEHVDLRHRDYDYLFFQIYGGRQSIEGHTGKPVVFIAYPSGKYDDAVLRFLTAHHFWVALTTNPGHPHTLNDALTWTRVRVSGQLTLDGFAKALGVK